MTRIQPTSLSIFYSVYEQVDDRETLMEDQAAGGMYVRSKP
jgi:hypothetical protein